MWEILDTLGPDTCKIQGQKVQKAKKAGIIFTHNVTINNNWKIMIFHHSLTEQWKFGILSYRRYGGLIAPQLETGRNWLSIQQIKNVFIFTKIRLWNGSTLKRFWSEVLLKNLHVKEKIATLYPFVSFTHKTFSDEKSFGLLTTG